MPFKNSDPFKAASEQDMAQAQLSGTKLPGLSSIVAACIGPSFAALSADFTCRYRSIGKKWCFSTSRNG
jgi:S-methylmethionine-dependent homocysteine/selenocysteine methylase